MKYLFPFLLTCLVILGTISTTHAQEKPNIILIYIDDWAWYGSPVAMDDTRENSRMPILQMPHLEELAQQGMKFRNAYGSPQCGPARVAIQTGQSAANNGFTLVLGKTKDDYFDQRKQYQQLPVVPTISNSSLDTTGYTIANVLAPLGYVSAHLGKWHMYCDPVEAGYVVHDGDTTNKPGNTLTAKNGKRIPDDMTDPKLMFSMTEKAIGFMEDQVQAGKPFYLQISHYAMHAGSECLPATREKYASMPELQAYYEETGQDAATINRKGDPAVWFGMGEDLDGRIGAVLDKVRELGIEDHTYVVVTADNGYRHKELGVSGLKQPLHAAKWWAWDGGIRVPMIVRGPGIPAGSKFKGNVVNYDFMPTFLEWAGGDPASLENVDGISLAGYMRGESPDKTFLNRPLYFHLPHYRSEIPHSAIIAGPHKVIHFYDAPDTPILFDISQDIGEVVNIAQQNAETHQKLFDQMMSYFEEVEARIPKINPDYDPERYKNLKSYEKYIRWGSFAGTRPLADDEQ
ncbi:MAG: sulfatase-like hydrolase/transferase [Verrucomicrobiota bacterium]